MLTVKPLDELHATIQFADALSYLGANNTRIDLTGEQCAVLIGAITDRLTVIADLLEKELKAQRKPL